MGNFIYENSYVKRIIKENLKILRNGYTPIWTYG